MDFEWVMSEKGQSSDDQIRPSVDVNILVVDDDSTTLAIVASILQILSYKVETAKNPLDALATLRMQTGVFDLVLTDLHMPYMNGFELQQQVQKEFKIPVIMMSADDDDSVMLQSLKNGIVLFIPKPVNPEDLKDVWQFARRTKKGKSVVIEEIPPTPIAPQLIDLGDDDDDDDNQGDQSLTGPGSSSSDSERASGAETEAAAVVGAGARIPKKQPGNKRGNRPPPPKDGNKRGSGSTSSKKACCRAEIVLIDAPAGRRRRPRRPKVIWTNSLHNRFLLAIKHLSFDKAVPKKILEFMNVPGLTRENVASHLQKYRLFLKRVAQNSVTGRLLAERIWLRSSFASCYPIKMKLQTAQQLYPQLPGRPSQPLLLPPAPQPPSQSQLINNNNSSIPSSAGPAGIPTLLTNNHPAPANVVQQPVLDGGTTTATAGNGVAAKGIGNDSNALVNHGGNTGFMGGVNPMQAWQQQNQARVGPFAGTTYPSNSNVGSPNNYLAPNNPSGVNMISGNIAGYNQLPAGDGVPNGIGGIGGGRLIGTTNGLGLNGNMMNGANFGYGQVGIGSFSGGVSGAKNPLVAAQAPLVLLNNNCQQQNANAALPPPPPPMQHLQLGRLTNLRGGNFNNNNNAEDEVADVAENNDPAFGSGGVFLDQNNVLPPSNYQALIDEIPCDLSDISFEEVDQNDQVNPAPTTQIHNPDPFAAGPSRVQENAPNPEQSLGLQQLRIEDLVDPLRLMNIENLPHEIDWDALMDALLRDDFAPENWRE